MQEQQHAQETAAISATSTIDKTTAADRLPTEDKTNEKFLTNGTDLWQLVRSGFLFPQVNHARIDKSLKQYRKNPRAVERTLSKATPYLRYVYSRIASRNMPTELVLLPFVESAYDPLAFSQGRAAGLWQFIPGTGKHFGLQQNWWYDGRRDVVASTDAALDYLEQLNKEFDGDWLHALAAYNAGGGTLRKAIRKNREAGKPTDYWSLKLSAETTGYVPRLLALKTIIAKPAQYGFKLDAITPTPVFAVVDTGSQIDLAIAAELAGIEISELQALNPGFNRWATPPEGPHQLAIPSANAEQFKLALAELPESKKVKWVRHRIRRGETLGHIARKYKTTVAVVQQTNGLKGSNIRTGTHLLVPVAAKDPQVYAAFSPGQAVGHKKTTYTVQPGDSLWKIARSHRVSMHNLADWNNLHKNKYIKPGQRLVLWNSKHASARATTRQITYTVRTGDSLSAISNKFNVSVDSLRRWNASAKRKYIQPGDKLKIHVDVTRQALSS